MKRAIAAAALLVALVGCSDPADSEECRTWQKDLLELRAAFSLAQMDAAVADASMADDRPEGCPWPQT